MLAEETFNNYIKGLSQNQITGITTIRNLIVKNSPLLVEKINEGKWYNGLLIYQIPDNYFTLFALGPTKDGKITFHMMPLYGSTTLQDKHYPKLKKWLSGKSCIKFRSIQEIPIASIEDIIKNENTVKEK